MFTVKRLLILMVLWILLIWVYTSLTNVRNTYHPIATPVRPFGR